MKSPYVWAGLCAITAVLAAAGCSASPGPSAGRPSRAAMVNPETTSTVGHWGSFFGGPKGNFDIKKSPVTVTLPGTVREVGTSNSTEYALLTNGSLYAWGLGTQGQLGNARHRNSFSSPVRVRFPAGVKIASIPTDVMPYDTGLAVDTKGNAWGWGDNGGGELCLGNTTAHSTPVELPLTDVTALAGASNHALYDSQGTVYACGQNIDGDLGDGTTRNTTTPRKVARLHGRLVTMLVASFANSGALLSDGRYFDWGFDGSGQLGNGLVRHSSDVPVRVHLPHPVIQVAQGGSIWNNGQTLVMLSNGSLWSWGNDRAGPAGRPGHARGTPAGPVPRPGTVSSTGAWPPGRPPRTPSRPRETSMPGASGTWGRWGTGARAPRSPLSSSPPGPR